MSRRNRRQFLEDSMFAAAAAVAAPKLLSADEQPQSSSPNERIGVAVVGVRGRGGSHISAFAGRKDTEIRYICDVDSSIGRQRAVEIGKRQGREPIFVEDIRLLLERESIDVVTIATPNHWHALASIWSIQAGKDVYVEKPVSHNVTEGRRIVQAARKHNKICQTGTQCRSNPGMRDAMRFVQSGELGQVKVARGLCYKLRQSIGAPGTYEVPSSVNYNLWLGPAPEVPLTRPQFHYDWHWQWAYGNGDLGNQGIHQMDLARWGLGVNQLSKRVVSYGGRFGYEDAGETANTQVVIHEYDDRSLIFEVRGLPTNDYRGAKVGVIFECDQGYVVMTSYESGAAFDQDGDKIKDFSGGADHFQNFLNAVRSRNHEDLNADIEDGHLSSALCHMGNISYQLGTQMPAASVSDVLDLVKSNDNIRETFDRTLEHLATNNVDMTKQQIVLGLPLELDPATEKFVSEEKANQMLTRDYRAPFVVPSEDQV